MSTVYDTETYEHKNGKTYHVEWSYGDDGPPDVEHDGHGVITRMTFDPSDDGAVADHIEATFEEDSPACIEAQARLSMMRLLVRESRWGTGRYYDVWETLKKAKAEGWGVSNEWAQEHPEATEHDKLMHAVMCDFEYLHGWYNDEWHWCVVGVAPLDEDGEPMEEYRQYGGGYESTIHDPQNKAYHDEAIEDQIVQVEWALREELHKDQMELPLA